MLKRMILLLVMLTVPNLASAYNYWSISATTSPVVASAITAPAGADYATSGTTTNVVTATVTSAAFTVAPAPAGYVLSYVTIDGVKTAGVNGVYTVNKGTKINHTLIAVYSAQKFTITTSKTGNGVIDPTCQVAAGGTKTINVTAAAGYKYTIAGVADATLTAGDGVTAGSYTFANLAGNETVTATFSAIPAVTAKIATGSQTVVTGTALTIDGSTSTATVTPTYTWSVSPAGATVAPNGNKATFNSSAAGVYTVTLKVSAPGAADSTASVVISATTQALADSGICINCHAQKDPAKVTAFKGSVHAAAASVTVSCQACHTQTNFNNTTTNTMAVPADKTTLCSGCHNTNADVQGLIQAQNWANSLHNIANNHFEQIYCSSCHDSHGLVATATDDKTDSCAACHVDRRGQFPGAGNYSIYTSASKLVLKAPHGGGKAAPAAGAVNVGDSTTQFVTNGAVCTDCHGHDNSINAGYAEGAHGEVSSEPLNPFAHYDWSARTNNGTRQNGNCDRCHTTSGFANLLGDTALGARVAPQAGKPGGVLLCVTCHKTTEGELRIDATPAGSAAGALSNGYFALFSSASPTAAGTQGQVAAGNTKIQIAFPGYKNSSICIPCHSGRSTAAVFVAVIDQANAVHKNYSTVSTSYYQHGKNIGQNFISQGAYDFTGKLAAIAASPHTAVKMGASDDQGPCVGCHYSTTGSTHSLAVDPTSPTCLNAASCHSSAPDVVTAQANFQAGVAALDTLIRSKFASLQTVAGQDLATERANVRFGRFGKAAGVAADATTAKAAYGAWYNWQILATYDAAAWAHNPRYARQLLNDTLGYLQTATVKTSYSAANDVQPALNAALALNPAHNLSAANTWITAPGCAACHSNKVTTFTTSGAYHNDVRHYSCVNCHSEQHITGALPTCSCHGDNATTHPTLDALNAPGAQCAGCHSTTDVHSIKGADITTKGCLDCHAQPLTHPAGKVADNNGGVRAIVPEFGKNAHHVTGKTLTNADCAVCHLEGNAGGSVNTAYHMKDAKIHLRNGGGVAEYSAVTEFAWDPANPVHSDMDKFCMSCHNANGAPAAVGIVTGNSASNPFADTISNGYDQMSRAKVVSVYEQFDPSNASHHAVRGKKYTTRSQISKTTTAAGYVNYSSAASTGARTTMYEAGMFVSTYTPLGASASVGDDSTLHCGDCHTVGQFKPGSTTDAMGNPTTVAIGAHGSANEYLLRNAYGSDALHHQEGFNGTTAAAQGAAGTISAAGGNYVCYLCHSINKYGLNQRHNGIDNGTNCDGHETVGATGVSNADTGVSTPTGAGQLAARRISGISSGNGLGNTFGYSCAYCHNAGLKGFGGIHGSNASFVAYSSNGATGFKLVTRKPYRFMPGLSNRYTGGATADKWELKSLTSTKDGCYNLTTTADTATSKRLWGTDATYNGGTTDAAGNVIAANTSSQQMDGTINGSWGACGHHTGLSTSSPTKPTRAINRPLVY